MADKREKLSAKIAKRLLHESSREQCDSIKRNTGLVLTAIVGIGNVLLPLNIKWVCAIIVLLSAAIQIGIHTICNEREGEITSREEKEVDALKQRLEIMNGVDYKYHYHQCLARERAVLLSAFGEMITSNDIGAYYNKVVDCIKSLLIEYAHISGDNLAIHLYVSSEENKDVISRVGVSNSVNNVINANKKAKCTSISKPRRNGKKRPYYYAKCMNNTEKSAFFLRDNASIRARLVEIDSISLSHYSQYFACRYNTDNGLRYLIEIISFNGTVITKTQNGQDLADFVTTPLAEYLLLLGNKIITGVLKGDRAA